jgi:hypothetical protein
MASTGSSPEALNAGMIPARTPIIIESKRPRDQFPNDMLMEKEDNELTRALAPKVMSSPITPPKRLRKTDSKRNCRRMK